MATAIKPLPGDGLKGMGGETKQGRTRVTGLLRLQTFVRLTHRRSAVIPNTFIR